VDYLFLKSVEDFNEKNYVKMREEVLDFLPKRFINAHVHTTTKTINPKELENVKLNRYILRKPLYDKKEVFERIYPGKEMLNLGIPLPLIKAGISPEVCNEMMIERIAETGQPGLVLPTNLDKSLEMAKEKGVKISGVKFHPWQFNREKREDFGIREYFNEELLEKCEKNDLTILSELFSGWTEEDKKTLKEVSENYKLKIVVPHLGLNYVDFKKSFVEYKEISESYEKFKKELKEVSEIDNLFVDTSMMIYESMLKAGIEEFGEERVMWGDDFPFGFSQKIIEVRFDNAILGEALYNIVNGEFDKVKEEWKYFFNEYQQIAELKEAFEKIGMDNEKVKKKLFVENAKKVYNIEF
jgi:predicted TIM-barrel fold metal-dependent hydrolase